MCAKEVQIWNRAVLQMNTGALVLKENILNRGFLKRGGQELPQGTKFGFYLANFPFISNLQ
jgi:hypothetical protein